ncbi:MAG: response regulator transcription factor [Bacteroidetes bacterium]|nr:response regulator transcription factor [Bacteroidota bacterium]
MNKDRTILLLEDDANLGFIIAEHLEMNGFRVRHCLNGAEGLTSLRRSPATLCLVDVMMPKMDGFTFVRELRTFNEQLPVIFLTARSLKEDRIEGLRLGADDYITKPFSMEELLLRIHAVLKRSTPSEAPAALPAEYRIGSMTFQVSRSLLLGPSGKGIRLTTKETGLLAMLCARPNDVVDRERILAAVWNSDSHYAARSMDVYVSKLRKYLKKEPKASIVNVHGKGYKLLVDP